MKAVADGLENFDVFEAKSDGSLAFPFEKGPWRLTQVFLQDCSDVHSELAWEREILLHQSESSLALHGNLFVIESLLASTGVAYVNEAPLPHARAAAPFDFRVSSVPGGFAVELSKDGSWSALPYSGGYFGRCRALQSWQRAKRGSSKLPKFLSNTWGDRSRDSRVQESFVLREIDAAKRLGVEIVQIDDGWQQGRSCNSGDAGASERRWEGFWNSGVDFWAPDPKRFPNGFAPLVERAKACGVELGLWFAPDSWNEFANWRKDLELLLKLNREAGVRRFKLDSINAKTPLAMERVRGLIDSIARESNGEISIDLDITAQVRPGYFGALKADVLFVENRYTDSRSYFPHASLRALWTLARWVDPSRLRIELLNASRNKALYEGDPLAPATCSPATLFATTMFANPLGWFEISNLPEAYFSEIAPLVALWKSVRAELFAGTLMPVGSAPDGVAWTGFVSISPDRASGFLLLFRELNEESSFTLRVPGVEGETLKLETLAGSGSLSFSGKEVRAEVFEKLGFVFGRLRGA